jgi:hypothetical protein
LRGGRRRAGLGKARGYDGRALAFVTLELDNWRGVRAPLQRPGGLSQVVTRARDSVPARIPRSQVEMACGDFGGRLREALVARPHLTWSSRKHLRNGAHGQIHGAEWR